jgi:hypothetical protein
MNPWRYIVLMLPIVLYFLGMPNSGLGARGGSTADLEAGMGGAYAKNTGLKIIKGGEVVGVAQDSPAFKAGIRVHDYITKIAPAGQDGPSPLEKAVSIKAMSAEEAAKVIGGEDQTKVGLTVQHAGQDKPEEIELTRKKDTLVLEFLELERASYDLKSRNYFEGRTVRLKGQYAPGNDRRTFSLVRFKIKCCAADAIVLNVVIRLDPQAQGDLSQFKPNDWIEVMGRVEFLKKRGQEEEYVAVLNVPSSNDVVPAQPESNPYLQ